MKKILLASWLPERSLRPLLNRASASRSASTSRACTGASTSATCRPPALVVQQPVLIAPPRVAVPRRPIYLYVSRRPPARLGPLLRPLCGLRQPVYFVRDSWVRERYEHEHPAGTVAASAAGTSTMIAMTIAIAIAITTAATATSTATDRG